MRYGLFTTGDIAKRLNLAMRTVAVLVDSGDLKGHYVPGGRKKYRRVTRSDLIAFCRRIGRDEVADELELEVAQHVLVATRDEELAATVATLSREKRIFVTNAPTTYDLGSFAAEHRKIDVLVADTASFPSLNEIRGRLAAVKCDPREAVAVMRNSQERLVTPWERFVGTYDPQLLCARIESKLAELAAI